MIAQSLKQTRLYKKVQGFSMRKKMILSFSVPSIIICIIVNLISYSSYSGNYERQFQYSVNQSCVQASNFMSNYMANMYYIDQLVEKSQVISEILSQEDFGKKQERGEEYREFLALNGAFREIEQSNYTYRIGIYIPDEIEYSNNNYYFYPQSELESRSDYEILMKTLDEGSVYYGHVSERRSSQPSEKDDYIALFDVMHVMREGIRRDYVIKVEILQQNVKEVLANTSVTAKNLVYMLDETGKYLESTDRTEYQKAQENAEFPTNYIKSWSEIQLNGADYYVIYQNVSGYNWQIFSLIPLREYHKQTSFVWKSMAVTILFLSLAIILISFFLSKYYVSRLSRLNRKMKSIQNGNLNTQIGENPDHSGDELDEIYASFNYMTDEVRRLMKEHYRLGKNVMSAELKALQAQINPHFLYNTLDLINWGAMEHGADEVAEMVRNLGQFYRLSLNHGKTAIHIEEELKHVQAYTRIENVHFGGAVNLEIDVPEEIRQLACLNIILQPFVENAIVHGIAEFPDIIECNIRISARIEEEDIIFQIEDDGPGIEACRLESLLDDSQPDKNNGYGVKNINFRIKLCYGDRYGVTYEKHAEEGTTVYIRIPAMEYEELEEILM